MVVTRKQPTAQDATKRANRNSSIPISARLVASTLVAIISSAQLQSAAQACQQVQTNYGIVCKCTESQCDSELKFEWPADDTNVLRMVSNEAGTRFQLSSIKIDKLIAAQTPTTNDVQHGQPHFRVELDINRHRQQVAGYGGAFTDSASMLIKDKLSGKCREQLMRSYFAPTGLNYNLARVPIGGTDMSWRPYSYDDLDGESKGATSVDFELKRFKLQREDFDYKLPLIKSAIRLRPGSEPLRLLASSWSAPNWMKSNNKLVQGRLKDDVDHETAQKHKHGQKSIDGKYYDAYARYIIRFLDEYERLLSNRNDGEHHNSSVPFKIWALTPQNEPCTPGRLGHSVVNYNSVNFSPAQIGRFVRCHLVPSLLRSNRTARDMALFVWDDTLLGLDKYKDHLFRKGSHSNRTGKQSSQDEDDENELETNHDDDHHHHRQHEELADQYVRGLALHWYSQGLDKVPYKAMYELRRWLPNRFSLLSTEASFIGRPQPGNWSRGERYARDIIMNFRTGSLGWIDWNLALNLDGGPTWSRNFLDSAVLVDEQAGSYLKNPMFYAIGHLSRFIKAGSHILESQIGIGQYESGLGRTGALANNTTTWRLVDEHAEQTSELLVVASEQTLEVQSQSKAWRPIAVVLLNRAPNKRRVLLSVMNCRSSHLNEGDQLELELSAKSITSLAFNC